MSSLSERIKLMALEDKNFHNERVRIAVLENFEANGGNIRRESEIEEELQCVGTSEQSWHALRDLRRQGKLKSVGSKPMKWTIGKSEAKVSNKLAESVISKTTEITLAEDDPWPLSQSSTSLALETNEYSKPRSVSNSSTGSVTYKPSLIDEERERLELETAIIIYLTSRVKADTDEIVDAIGYMNLSLSTRLKISLRDLFDKLLSEKKLVRGGETPVFEWALGENRSPPEMKFAIDSRCGKRMVKSSSEFMISSSNVALNALVQRNKEALRFSKNLVEEEQYGDDHIPLPFESVKENAPKNSYPFSRLGSADLEEYEKLPSDVLAVQRSPSKYYEWKYYKQDLGISSDETHEGDSSSSGSKKNDDNSNSQTAELLNPSVFTKVENVEENQEVFESFSNTESFIAKQRYIRGGIARTNFKK